jgi:hypothetical protein
MANANATKTAGITTPIGRNHPMAAPMTAMPVSRPTLSSTPFIVSGGASLTGGMVAPGMP